MTRKVRTRNRMFTSGLRIDTQTDSDGTHNKLWGTDEQTFFVLVPHPLGWDQIGSDGTHSKLWGTHADDRK